MAKWYVSKGGNTHGPFSPSQLKQLAQNGQITPEDFVQKDGGPTVTARHVEGLFDSLGASAGVERPTAAVPPPVSQPQRESSWAGSTPVAQQVSQDGGYAVESSRPNHVQDGMVAAKAVLRSATLRLHTSFGSAFAAANRTALTALSDLWNHPFRLSFALVVLILACLAAVPALITMVLIPVFVLGYLRYTEAVLTDRRAVLSDYISFMRHGWDALWHLLMLLASFYVTLAMMIAPVALACVVGYFALGTLSSGALQIAALGDEDEDVADDYTAPSHQPNWDDFESAKPPTEEKESLLAPLLRAAAKLGAFGLRIVMFIITFVVITLLLTPITGAVILVSTLVLAVSKGSPKQEARFDLVYDAFSRMLGAGRIHWKRLVCSGLVLSAILTGVWELLPFIAELLGDAELFIAARWLTTFVYPVVLLAFVIYASVFCVRTTLDLGGTSASRSDPAPE